MTRKPKKEPKEELEEANTDLQKASGEMPVILQKAKARVTFLEDMQKRTVDQLNTNKKILKLPKIEKGDENKVKNAIARSLGLTGEILGQKKI